MSSGQYFGEISIIFGSNRTSEVQSITYVTLASLSAQNFQKIWDYSPDLYESFKERAFNYDDEWT